jgi:hypothetical protein
LALLGPAARILKNLIGSPTLKEIALPVRPEDVIKAYTLLKHFFRGKT